MPSKYKPTDDLKITPLPPKVNSSLRKVFVWGPTLAGRRCSLLEYDVQDETYLIKVEGMALNDWVAEDWLVPLDFSLEWYKLDKLAEEDNRCEKALKGWRDYLMEKSFGIISSEMTYQEWQDKTPVMRQKGFVVGSEVVVMRRPNIGIPKGYVSQKGTILEIDYDSRKIPSIILVKFEDNFQGWFYPGDLRPY